MLTPKRFRKAYVIQQTPHDLTALRDFADRIEFVFLGSEEAVAMTPIAADVLRNFDPTSDLVVPVGTVLANLVAGSVLGELSSAWAAKEYRVAVYQEKQYQILTINLADVSSKELPHGE